MAPVGTILIRRDGSHWEFGLPLLLPPGQRRGREHLRQVLHMRVGEAVGVGHGWDAAWLAIVKAHTERRSMSRRPDRTAASD